MAERPEDLSLPASVVARIIKDAVSEDCSLLVMIAVIFAASRRSQCFQGSKNSHRQGSKCIHLICYCLVRGTCLWGGLNT